MVRLFKCRDAEAVMVRWKCGDDEGRGGSGPVIW